jgi:uncharacterized membrane protein YecN with MAPEG domain
LTVRVIRLRRRLAIGLGTGGDAELEQAVRGHGNFTEYAPIGLTVLASAELSGASAGWVHAIGVLLIAGRLLHAWGLSKSSGYSIGRSTGMVTTITALIVGIVVNLVQVFGH